MLKSTGKTRAALLALTTVGLLATAGRAQEIAVKNGEKIAFLGDSITQQGAGSPSGYVRLVISGLEANGVKAEAIPAGISGHKSNQMLERLDRDVISKKPNWMTLSCGVNDVWHGERGVPLDQYKTNITSIVDKAQAAGIKVMLLTSTMIREDQTTPENQKLVAYNDFLRALAAEKKLPLADLNADMQAAIKAAPPHRGNLLTGDGVHMNPLGNQMMAAGVLKAFGLSDAQLQKAREAWLDTPRAVEFSPKTALTLRQYNQLSDLAIKQNRSVNDLLNEELAKAIEALLKQPQ
jgi:lysophospholipase L1-like esterase